jgi:hypothetical protein
MPSARGLRTHRWRLQQNNVRQSAFPA